MTRTPSSSGSVGVQDLGKPAVEEQLLDWLGPILDTGREGLAARFPSGGELLYPSDKWRGWELGVSMQGETVG